VLSFTETTKSIILTVEEIRNFVSCGA